ncbi:MAG: lytic transglycosylase domain-containing protein [Bradymonadaceae bacterium]|nr:lytic transglycosylase domain-containing protein [Lujinxingiaceae bacterium]
MALCVAAAPSLAVAQIYTYETPTGELLITTEPRSDLKLRNKVSGDHNSSRISAPRDRKAVASTPRPAAPTNRPSFSQRENSYDDIIREAAAAFDVPFGFVKAIIRIESGFQFDATSPVGAMGLMQLMPRTAASLDVTDAYNPRQNIFGGAKFLRILIDRYDGDINLILSAYNAGDVAVRRYDGIPYPKTRQYVASVYHWYQIYGAAEENL